MTGATDRIQALVPWVEVGKFLVYGAVFFILVSAVTPVLQGGDREQGYAAPATQAAEQAAAGSTPALCNETGRLVDRVKTFGSVQLPSDYSNHLIIDYKGEGLQNWTTRANRSGHGDYLCKQGGPEVPQPGYFYCEPFRDTPLVLDSTDGTGTVVIESVVLDDLKSITAMSCSS